MTTKKFKPFPKKDIKIPKKDEKILKILNKREAYKIGYAKGQLVEAFALKKKKYWK